MSWEKEPAQDFLPQSYSMQDIYDAWRVPPSTILALIRAGRVGFIRAGRSRRFLPEHIAQLREAIEVKPTRDAEELADFTAIGVTPRSRSYWQGKRIRAMLEDHSNPDAGGQ